MRRLVELLGRFLTDQEQVIAGRLLSQGVPVEGVLEALRGHGEPDPPVPDDELRVIRYEALQDGTVRRIE